MKIYHFKLFISALALTGIFFFSSCEEDNTTTLCTDLAFNIDLFEENVIDALDGKVMGYSYVIMQNGNVTHSGAGGLRTNSTDGASPMTINDRIHIASVSKFITTVATMHLLEEKEFADEDTPIIEFLPADWDKGDGIESITFLDLLSQRAGLNVFGTQNRRACRYDSLQMYVAAGATQPKEKNYTNSHHGLMRIILPRLWDKYRPNDGAYDEEFTTSVYQSCIQELLLEPLGINASCDEPTTNLALAYSSSTDTGNGQNAGDLGTMAGGFGWYMNSLEVAKLWAYSWYTNDFINDDSRQIMTDNTAGLWNTTNGDKGTYYNKLGGWNWTGNESYNAIAMHYPNDVDLIVLTNSTHDDGLGLVPLGVSAYDDSYACQ